MTNHFGIGGQNAQTSNWFSFHHQNSWGGVCEARRGLFTGEPGRLLKFGMDNFLFRLVVDPIITAVDSSSIDLPLSNCSLILQFVKNLNFVIFKKNS